MGQRKNKTFEQRCEQVYEYFMDFYTKNRLAPSYSDMVKGTGIQRGNLAPIINQLVDNGKLERKGNTSRGLWPTYASNGSMPIHFMGHIAANNLNPLVVLDLLDSETTIEVPRYLLPLKGNVKEFYVLQVKGNSMAGANILDQDYVVMQSGKNHKDDDIVAVLIKDENAVTLKMLKQTERGNVKLQPKSHRHNPRIENAENIEVQGRVVAVMRKY